MAATADRQAGHRNESLFVGVENDFRSRLLNDRSRRRKSQRLGHIDLTRGRLSEVFFNLHTHRF
jgi:hypothetical protein